MEYSLIPKRLVEEFIKFKTNPRVRDLQTERIDTHAIYPRNGLKRQVKEISNPDISNFLRIYLDEKYLPYAISVIEYYTKHTSLSFDDTGKITNPNIDLNMMELLRFYITNKIEKQKKYLVKELNEFIPVPAEFIRHALARKYISGAPVTSGATSKNTSHHSQERSARVMRSESPLVQATHPDREHLDIEEDWLTY